MKQHLFGTVWLFVMNGLDEVINSRMKGFKMEGYLGETPVKNLKGTPYEGYGPKEWALLYIACYGGIDGGHHKQWVLDQITRILHGTSVELTLAKWSNGHQEYRFTTGKPSAEYLAWVEEMKGEYDEENEEYEYNYDMGIAP